MQQARGAASYGWTGDGAYSRALASCHRWRSDLERCSNSCETNVRLSPEHMPQNETVDNCHVKLSHAGVELSSVRHMNTGWKKQDTHPCFHDVRMTMLGELFCV
jgi:hypothetical protein